MSAKLNPGECIPMPVRRYDLGTEYRGNIGAPAIVGKVNGRYVSYEDYAVLVTHNELLSLQLQRLSKQRGMLVGQVFTMEALVPGGEVRTHATIFELLPAGTKLYTAPQNGDKQ